MRARLRRDGNRGLDWAEVLRADGLVVHTASRELERYGNPIQLTVRKYDLLLHLPREPNKVHELRQIIASVWDEGYAREDNRLDVYIRTYARRWRC